MIIKKSYYYFYYYFIIYLQVSRSPNGFSVHHIWDIMFYGSNEVRLKCKRNMHIYITKLLFSAHTVPREETTILR